MPQVMANGAMLVLSLKSDARAKGMLLVANDLAVLRASRAKGGSILDGLPHSLTPAADDDLRSAGDLSAGSGGLLAHRAFAGNLHLQTFRGDHFDHVADGQANQAGHAEFLAVADADVAGRAILRRRSRWTDSMPFVGKARPARRRVARTRQAVLPFSARVVLRLAGAADHRQAGHWRLQTRHSLPTGPRPSRLPVQASPPWPASRRSWPGAHRCRAERPGIRAPAAPPRQRPARRPRCRSRTRLAGLSMTTATAITGLLTGAMPANDAMCMVFE